MAQTYRVDIHPVNGLIISTQGTGWNDEMNFVIGLRALTSTSTFDQSERNFIV